MTSPMRPSRFSQHRAQVDRVQSVVAQDTWVLGRIYAEGLGEFSAQILFPVRFQDRPYPLLSGVEMADDTPDVEHVPDVDSAVVKWIKTDNGSHFVGAEVYIRVGGRAGQRVWITYGFFENAMSAIPSSVEDSEV
jgi:hypothetical protein